MRRKKDWKECEICHRPTTTELQMFYNGKPATRWPICEKCEDRITRTIGKLANEYIASKYPHPCLLKIEEDTHGQQTHQ